MKIVDKGRGVVDDVKYKYAWVLRPRGPNMCEPRVKTLCYMYFLLITLSWYKKKDSICCNLIKDEIKCYKRMVEISGIDNVGLMFCQACIFPSFPYTTHSPTGSTEVDTSKVGAARC